MARNGSANRSDVAYERLRADIIAGRWLPDTTLSTYGLAEELGMSRTPIIGALKRLEADALIEIIPQVGCRVLRRAHEEISETFMIRAALEALGAEMAAERITDDELAALDRILDEAEAAADAGDSDRYENANREFHTGILAASRFTHMQRILGGLWTLNRYQLAASRFLSTRMHVSSREHRTILDALKAHDPDAAREAAGSHLRRCSQDYLDFVEDHAEHAAETVGAPGPA
jgi:DNA-binding GntR family transcriptional regulator